MGFGDDALFDVFNETDEAPPPTPQQQQQQQQHDASSSSSSTAAAAATASSSSLRHHQHPRRQAQRQEAEEEEEYDHPQPEERPPHQYNHAQVALQRSRDEADGMGGKKRALENPASDRSDPGSPAVAHAAHNGVHQPPEGRAKKPRVDKDVLLTDVTAVQVEREVAAVGQEAETEKQIKISHSVRHQVALPPDYPYVPIAEHAPPEKPAREYPFTLDPFQQYAIYAIQREESVLVSAHTSAGKTVVAEYAIAQGLQNKQRVIYTSPIKALSNQKYRELQAEFNDVGLMTGDVTINPSASCLVMTTEILRSMLYRGSEIMREVAWVVFDEVHYMRDKARGVVWEETLILLPHKVHHVFLSATIPNAYEFAQWIVKIHDQPCHVVYTDFRPTPLQHYLFPAGGNGIYLAVDEKGVFREDNFSRAMSELERNPEGTGPIKGKKKPRKGKPIDGPSDVYKIVKMIMSKNYHPVIVFSFSKRECEANALQMSKINFNDKAEAEMVKSVFENGISSLSEDDRNLPQIVHLLPLLQRGIGVHHSGLLPILKEIIEILFQEGLIKLLCATETFSIGLNMPAKTVVFTNVQKFDGVNTRWISGGEYIQMSGRAGRRGLDDRGIVIMMLDDKMETSVAKSMVKGEADPLNSAFHLGYTMILNLLRVEGISPEYMLQRSFFQFQSISKVPKYQEAVEALEDEYNALEVPNESSVAKYWEIRQQLARFSQDVRDVVMHPNYCMPFLQPGRLLYIKSADGDFGWGVLMQFVKRISKKATPLDKDVSTLLLDVMVYCSAESKGSAESSAARGIGAKPVTAGGKGEMKVITCTLSSVEKMSLARLFLPKDLRGPEERKVVHKMIQETRKRCKGDFPILSPVEHLKIKDNKFLQLLERIKALEARLKDHPLHNSPELEQMFDAYAHKMELKAQVRTARRQLSEAESVVQLEELKARKRVLRRLGYTTPSDVIELKGRVACEISAGDEIMLTEMIFNGVFNELSVEHTVGLLSCFVCDEASKEAKRAVPVELEDAVRLLKETASRIVKVSQESKLQIDEEEYLASFRTDLLDVVLAWCGGAPFSSICKMTDIFEGSIIRIFRRLEELLCQMAATAKAIGNGPLENKFTAGVSKIKRDIVFAVSLYL